MTKYKTIILLLICCVANITVDAQTKKEPEIYSNFEKNYNELLQSYYMKQNEKTLNQRFNRQGDNLSNEYRAANVSDSVYARRLRSLPSAVNLVYNDKVRSNIVYYIDRIGDRVGVMLGLSKYYFPIFENILDSYGIPSELKYLVVIESAFNPRAVSWTGAAGLWQFMYATGRVYDLRVNSVVDDRRDPIKETIAAAKYLKDLYKIYNDWSLVLAAYNCGPGNVNKAIKRSGKTDFWSIYNYLPNETRNYVPSYIAATYVMNFYKEHNISPINLSRPLDLVTDTVIVKKDIYFSQIEAVMGISVEELRDLNPQYKMDMIPGTQDRYSLKLPLKYINEFIEKEDSIASYHKEEFKNEEQDRDQSVKQTEVCYVNKTIYHKVQRNDTWYSIANRYGVSQQDLRSWNKKIKKKRLQRGTLLAVKTRVAVEKEKIIKTNTEKQTPFEETIVSADNTDNQEESTPIVTYPKRNRTTLTTKTKNTNKQERKEDKKSRKNKKDRDDNDNRSSKKNKNKETHSIKSGETISQIAKKYGISEEDLLKANKLDKSSAKSIRPGQKIVISKDSKDSKNSKSNKNKKSSKSKSKRRR